MTISTLLKIYYCLNPTWWVGRESLTRTNYSRRGFGVGFRSSVGAGSGAYNFIQFKTFIQLCIFPPHSNVQDVMNNLYLYGPTAIETGIATRSTCDIYNTLLMWFFYTTNLWRFHLNFDVATLIYTTNFNLAMSSSLILVLAPVVHWTIRRELKQNYKFQRMEPNYTLL